MKKRDIFQYALAVGLTLFGSRYIQGQTFLGDGPAVTISFDVLHADMPPVWSNGRLLILTGNRTAKPMIHMVDRNGYPTSNFVLQIPGADRIVIMSIGRQPSGGVVTGGFSWMSDGHETTFLALVSADGKDQRIIRTSPYTPYGLAVGSDGTIWTAGLEMIDRSENNPEIDPNYLMVRHFDTTGHLLGGFIPRSSLPKHALGVSESFLVVNRDTVGWLWGGNNYFLISPSGDIQRFVTPGTPDDYVTVGLTGSGSTVVTTQDSWCRFCTLINGRWVPVSLPKSLVGRRGLYIYGSEGENIVVRERARSSDTFYAHFLPVLP
jgi:hypothetical protein